MQSGSGSSSSLRFRPLIAFFTFQVPVSEATDCFPIAFLGAGSRPPIAFRSLSIGAGNMSQFPTREEAEAFANTRALSDWVGVAPTIIQAVEAQTGSLSNRIRNLSLLPASIIQAACSMAQVTVPGEGDEPDVQRQLSPIEVAQTGLCWRIAKRLSSPDWDTWVDVDPFAPPPPAPNTPSQIPQTGFAQPPAPPAAKIKLSAVLDQHDETEAPVAGESLISKWATNWTAFAQGPPLEEEDPTVDQLSALYHRVVTLKGSPYVDFAVYTPFNRRVARANKFMAHIMQPDASWLPKEIPGPQNFEAWGYCWGVFRCSAIQLAVVKEAALSRYRQNIATLVLEWPECWAIIYLADDKARGEGLARRRRMIEADIQAGLPPPRLWDPDNPWSACFMELAADRAYWDYQVRHLAIAWHSRGRHGELRTREQSITEAAISGGGAALKKLDANTEPPLGRHNPPGQGTSKHTKAKNRLKNALAQATSNNNDHRATPYTPPPPKGNKGGGKGAKGNKGKDKDKGNRGHQTTPQGKPICFGWNRGFGPCANVRGGVACPNDRAHVCQICLSPDHPAKDHPSR